MAPSTRRAPTRGPGRGRGRCRGAIPGAQPADTPTRHTMLSPAAGDGDNFSRSRRGIAPRSFLFSTSSPIRLWSSHQIQRSGSKLPLRVMKVTVERFSRPNALEMCKSSNVGAETSVVTKPPSVDGAGEDSASAANGSSPAALSPAPQPSPRALRRLAKEPRRRAPPARQPRCQIRPATPKACALRSAADARA